MCRPLWPRLPAQTSLAELAGRVIPGVDRLPQEVVLPIAPELGHLGIGEDDAIHQLVAGPPDAAGADILHHASHVVELQGAAGAVRNLDSAQRLHEPWCILCVPAGAL